MSKVPVASSASCQGLLTPEQGLRAREASRLRLGQVPYDVVELDGHVRVSHVSRNQRVFLDTKGCALGQAWWLFRLHFDCELRRQGRGWYTNGDQKEANELLALCMESFYHACSLAVRVCIGTVPAPADVRHAFTERFLVLGNAGWLVGGRPNGAIGAKQTRLLYVDPGQVQAYRQRRSRTT